MVTVQPSSTGLDPEAIRRFADDRAHLLDRLQNLRTIVPVFAEELASARRTTARLRVENHRLLDQVRDFERRLALEAPVFGPR